LILFGMAGTGMRLHRFARVAIAVLAVGLHGLAWAQDVYRSGGRWLDDVGRPYRLDALYGTPTVITMAYGACHRICATSLRMMEELQGLADARHHAVNFVVVGLDPQADRPSDWAAYRSERGLLRPNWEFLSGDEASTRQLARQLGIRYWRYGEHTLHNLRIVLLSPEGRPQRSIDAFDQSIETLLP
jgi:cytochrome oxidase Cu insertion factor (SCO1/SenC/PrrC family)